MKIDELKKHLKQLIREEVSAEVSKAMAKVLVEMVKEIKKPVKQETIVESTELEEQEAPAILKTNNPKLSSALAETARNYKPLPQQNRNSSMVDLMDGGFEKIGKVKDNEIFETPKPATKIDFLKEMVGETSVPANNSVLDSQDIPDHLKNVFKKDFKSILALSKQKKGLYSPNVSMG